MACAPAGHGLHPGIMGHSYPFVTESPLRVYAETFRSWLYCFHMPVFVWCAGYLLAYTDASGKQSFSAYMCKRGHRILIPYVAFSLIGIVPKILFSQYLNDSLSWDLQALCEAFLIPRSNIWGHFWFLPMIFIMGGIGFFLLRICSRRSHCLIALAVSCGMIWLPATTGWFSLDDIRRYLFFFVLGIATQKCVAETKGSLWFAATQLVASVIIFILPLTPVLKSLLVAVLMIYGMANVCQWLESRFQARQLGNLSRTYPVFILSWPCQLVAEIVLERILHCPYPMVMIAMFIFGICGPITILHIVDWIESKINRKVFSWALGG